MSDDQQIAIPVNRPDDCSVEQPPQDDAAAAAAAACPVQPPMDDAACPVQPPMDDAACPVPPLNYETKMSDVGLLSMDDDAASFTPPPNDDAGFAPVPNMDDGPASPPMEVENPASPTKEDASPASPPKEDASPASPPKEDASPASPLEEDASPAPPPEEDASPAPPPEGDASRAPPPMEDIAHSAVSPLPMDDSVPLVPRVEPEFSKADGLENTDGHDDGVQVKHEIKHETIDLGDDPYYYDDNKAILVNDPSKVGFDRGLEPDRIVGATEVNGKLMFLIAWKNANDADLLESTVVYNKCPQLAIQFFEARLKYCPDKKKK